jgi:hypothetical protein
MPVMQVQKDHPLGMRRNASGIRRLYFCKSCEKKFSEPSMFSRMRYDPKIKSIKMELFKIWDEKHKL